MKKFEETRTTGGGFGGQGITEKRVVSVKAGEEPPEGAREVPADTPAHDWEPAE